ncbi:hypothetical protein F4780DRAFT_751453 [Xylariomycetidae sp. FL0641]|nr:hypothetical protein F4780DRAFT_751453 [Xylariomycetidae sp. FL0641]
MASKAGFLGLPAHMMPGETTEFIDALDGSGHGTLLGPRLPGQSRSTASTEIDYEAIYAEYFDAQRAFSTTVNKYLAKLKLPPMEVCRTSELNSSQAKATWDAVQGSMEQACAVVDKASSRDQQLVGRTGKVKKLFRSLCQNAGTGKIFASLVPNDACGSVVSGGLNIIFKALEDTGVHREAVYKALERLPRTLEKHVEYTQLAGEDEEIQHLTAKLYTEVCWTLDSILRWFMMNTFVAGAKRLLQPDAFIKNLNDRLAAVDLAAVDLKERGAQIMMGLVSDISTTQKWACYQSVKIGRQLNSIEGEVNRIAERSTRIMSFKQLREDVLDSFETILNNSVKRLMIKHNGPQASGSIITPEEVLEELQYDSELVPRDVEKLLQLGRPSATVPLDVARVRAIQASPQVRAWLSVEDNSLLLINGATDALDPSISFVSAQLFQSLLQQSTRTHQSMDVVVIAYFCSQHRNYYRDAAATPAELAMSLLLQLVDGYRGFHSNDLKDRLEKTQPDDIGSICDSLSHLIHQLPSTVVVYMVVEGLSFCRLPPERQEGTREAVTLLVELFRKRYDATLKMLFTSATSHSFVEDVFDEDEVCHAPSDPAPAGDPFLKCTFPENVLGAR